MPKFIRLKLGERLLESGLITKEQYEKAMQKHAETNVILRQVLVDMGFISEEKLMEFMGVTLGIPIMKDLFGKITDPEVIKMIPEKTAREHTAIPLFKVGGVLTVAMADPLDVFAIDDLRSIAGCKIEAVLGIKKEIIDAINQFYSGKKDLKEVAGNMAQKAEQLEIIKEQKNIVEENEEDEMSHAEEAPIIQLVDTMIAQAVKEDASDIHIEPDEEKLRIRYRIDGVLREAMVPPKRLQASIISRIKVMGGMDISIKRAPQDGRLKIKIENKDIDVRISSIPTIYGEKIVMRLLDPASVRKDLKDAGFGEDVYIKFKELIERPYGIILVTGPTGSGKTTTLYLALQAINSPEKNIITIEEPVEYELEGINQIAVNVKAGVTFPSGLRSILRQDPDVIMVGEIRDLETADISVRAALTGHLVFSTLHTNDAASSIVRMVDMGVPLYLVTSSVCGVLAQRLVRTICPKCKESYKPSQEVLQEAGLTDTSKDYTFCRGAGCDHCGKTGYRGRTAIFELMMIDKELRAVIQAGKSSDEIRDTAKKNGMKLLWEDGLEKVIQGITTLEEVNKVVFMEQE